MFPEKLQQKINLRVATDSLRKLDTQQCNTILEDFCSNDYLGFAKCEKIITKLDEELSQLSSENKNGATGSRLLSGNSKLYVGLETYLAEIHQSEQALVFNSGYTANLGFFSCVPQRGDIVLYDELIHASIRDGIQLSNAKSYKFKHNDCSDLERQILKFNQQQVEVYVVTESVFSMDGDIPNLKKIAKIVKKHKVHLVVDEAHALGVFGLGLVQQYGIENEVFVRVITFGKALGCHGAVILGSSQLIQYLVNFSRPFIYTTGLPPHAVVTIRLMYEHLLGFEGTNQCLNLQQKITHFTKEVNRLQLSFIKSNSAIHCCVIPGNDIVKSIAEQLQQVGFNVKPILSPTVQKRKERLRICLHSYNSFAEIDNLLEQLHTLLKQKK